MNDEEEIALMKQTILEGVQVLPEPWPSVVAEHLDEECHWESTDPTRPQEFQGIRCVTHDVLIMPPPIDIFHQTDPAAVAEAARKANETWEKVNHD